MAILHVRADQTLEETLRFLIERRSPLSFKGKMSTGPLKNAFIFQAGRTNTNYVVCSYPFGQTRSVDDQAARELQFRHRVNISTFNFKPFPGPVTASTKEVVNYFLDNGVACYLLLDTLGQWGDIVIGGYNPRTDKLIETRGDYIHR